MQGLSLGESHHVFEALLFYCDTIALSNFLIILFKFKRLETYVE